jgi:hypothetical protein
MADIFLVNSRRTFISLLHGGKFAVISCILSSNTFLNDGFSGCSTVRFLTVAA